jgi:hypothetical protein
VSNPAVPPQSDWAPFIVGGMKQIEALAKDYKRVYSDGDLVIVDLAAAR